jgi:hypothetical protein
VQLDNASGRDTDVSSTTSVLHSNCIQEPSLLSALDEPITWSDLGPCLDFCHHTDSSPSSRELKPKRNLYSISYQSKERLSHSIRSAHGLILPPVEVATADKGFVRFSTILPVLTSQKSLLCSSATCEEGKDQEGQHYVRR